jgi:hypothetical protein
VRDHNNNNNNNNNVRSSIRNIGCLQIFSRLLGSLLLIYGRVIKSLETAGLHNLVGSEFSPTGKVGFRPGVGAVMCVDVPSLRHTLLYMDLPVWCC